jgi:hypothetical protein
VIRTLQGAPAESSEIELERRLLEAGANRESAKSAFPGRKGK